MFNSVNHGGENINKIAISALIIVAIGLVAGGFAFVTNGDFAHVADNLVSNEVSDASNGDVSSNNNQTVNDASLDKDKQANEFSLSNIQNKVTSNHASLMANNVADNNVVTRFMNVAFASYNGDSDLFSQNIGDNQVFDPWNNINKNEYVLSPNYAEHIFIKIGQDFTDKYGYCVADGGFIPLGNITKAISADYICDLSCGIDDCYFDLSTNPYIYDYGDAEFYIKYGDFPSEIQKQSEAYISDYYNTNYKPVDGQDDVYVNVHQDFTDKYVLCMDCGRYVPLGTITTPLKDIMICDYPRHFGDNVYFDIDHPAVIGPDDAIASWDSFNEQRYSNPDYHPIHYDEPGYGEEDFSGYYSNNIESSQQNIDVNVVGNVSDSA
ncbi:hypothetical protein [Methanobrevibacter sp.]|uniref:hypothetical protein n=1 Tax=Methanobrevibacter sp. TaxID=66852 RepID=UPI00388D5DB2